MRILCFIDSLGSGGAQRQLVTLATGLKKRGHLIRFLVYHREDHFLPLLQAAGIPCEVIDPCSYLRRLQAVRRILRQGWQDVVLAFLEASCLYAELASIPRPKWGLVAGERLAHPAIGRGAKSWLRQFHRVADAIVCNSYTNQLALGAAFPCLRRQLCAIYNTVDLEHFRLSPESSRATRRDGEEPFRIVVVANYHEKKNMLNVAKALLLLKNQQNKPSVVMDWFGTVQPDASPFERARQFVSGNGLGEWLRLHEATMDTAGEYSRADAVGLFSFYEGLPNVVCEGMACGKPILMSNVCDAGNLVRDGRNGFLCDPGSPEDIAAKIHCMAAMGVSDGRRMGLESRGLAERLFAEDTVVERYECILTRSARHEPIPADCSWPTEIPPSALMTVARWAGEA